MRGPCPCSYTPGTGWHSPLRALLWAVLPQMGQDAVPGYKPLHGSSKDFRKPQERCWVSPSMPPLLVSGFQAWNGLPLFRPSVHPGILALSGGASLPSSVSICMTPGPFQFGSHGALLKKPRLHSLFLWLKGRNGGERTVPTSLSLGVEEGMALPGLLTSFGLKPLILTRFEAAEWQLVHVVGMVPRTGEGCPAPPPQPRSGP